MPVIDRGVLHNYVHKPTLVALVDTCVFQILLSKNYNSCKLVKINLLEPEDTHFEQVFDHCKHYRVVSANKKHVWTGEHGCWHDAHGKEDIISEPSLINWFIWKLKRFL